MDENIDLLDYLNNTLGSYDPYSLRILVNKTYSESKKTSPGIYSLNQRDCVTLFHEFIHQLQNTSSIIGFRQFDCIVSMWQNTRNIKFNIDDEVSNNYRKKTLQTLKKYACHKSDTPQKSGLLDVFEIECFDDIKKQIFTDDAIKIHYSYNSSHFYFVFGIGEFYESCAHILEEYFCKKINFHNKIFEANSIPYKTGESIANNIAPNCSNLRLIILMLTALQHSSPHQMFIFLMFSYGKEQCDDEVIKEICEKHVEELISINDNWIKETRNIIDRGFPIDDPYLGDVIKSFNSSINKNLHNRKSTPFLELDFLIEINEINYKNKLEDLIKNSGGSIIYTTDQSRPSSDEIENIVIGDHQSIYHNHTGWLTFITSILLTKKTQSIIDATILKKEEIYKCPAYFYCEHKNKKNNVSYCEKEPYKHPQALEGNDNCAHQLAIYKTDLRNYYSKGKV
ncbi:hypothetical protein V3429_06415 [Aeromonas jandaei]|uniref:hypothetical protein n=1 Tax=Aeromonas TaxID=642 RepID=UPI001C2155DB|nr:hypothetical protein [Aeromonas sp. FDAARGOS 1410]QXC39822.1 hypothetical protein I6L40_08350 [Aeromonas sp. FDAARGOS 1410]